jgi:hypothetical protein
MSEYYGSYGGLIGPSEQCNHCASEGEDLALPTHAWPGDERICEYCYQEEIGLMTYDYADGISTHWLTPVGDVVLSTIARDVKKAAEWLR